MMDTNDVNAAIGALSAVAWVAVPSDGSPWIRVIFALLMYLLCVLSVWNHELGRKKARLNRERDLLRRGAQVGMVGNRYSTDGFPSRRITVMPTAEWAATFARDRIQPGNPPQGGSGVPAKTQRRKVEWLI